ncbi:AI-2E family transporter [Paenibacillus beijingensis]|uniref:Membrane protein n=1 Tax=Paenibacillus beijingensis TaxID=1126833 RepID=A0A0D5NQ14_9BACL|nr:AI-2E family transporter [Paenibacillus beijingensis]AJY77023.1 membrane protein [Paenibacillus beijingensis]
MISVKAFFENVTVRRFSVLLLMVLLLYFLRGMLNLILLLFLVTYVMDRLQQLVTRQVNRLFPVNYKVVVIFLYLLATLGFVIGASNYLPQIITQMKQLSGVLITFVQSNLNSETSFVNELPFNMAEFLQKLDVQAYANHMLTYLLKFSKWVETILFVILLSFFFLLQKESTKKFTAKFRDSKIGWIYNELSYFGDRFLVSFGKVIEAQLIIAVFNTIFTTLGLWALGFPYLFALSIMILLLSLIPVAGVIISLVPLGLIAFDIGGIKMVVYILVMIMIIHALESYFLNPRLMSAKTELPMFYTFIILIFSQHYFGTWGLIIGIPAFVFVLDLLEVNQISKEEKALSKR